MSAQTQDIYSIGEDLYEHRDDFAQANSRTRKQLVDYFDEIGNCLATIAQARGVILAQEHAELTELLGKVYDLIRYDIHDYELNRIAEELLAFKRAEEFWRKLNEERDRDQYLARLHGASAHFKSLAASIATVDSRLLRIIGVDPERELIQELDGELRGRAGFFFEHPFATMIPELAGFTNLIIVFGSAGIFTAVYQIICKYMERHKDHEM
jgi:hypothetical protein